MKPMTVRQVFYQATVRGIVEKTEAGYTKVQTDLVHDAPGRAAALLTGLPTTPAGSASRTPSAASRKRSTTRRRFYRKALWSDADCLRRGLAGEGRAGRRRLPDHARCTTCR